MFIIYKNKFLIAIITSFFLVSGCSSVGGKFEPSSLSSLGKDEILVVGKIELFPALKADDYKIYGETGDVFFNKALIVTGDKVMDVSKISPSGFSIRHVAQTELGKTFFYEEDYSNPLVYSGGFIQTTYFSRTIAYNTTGIYEGKLILPGDLKFKLSPSDKAVYIGTIQYYRDKNNNITRVKLKDEFAQANALYKQKYGAGTLLKKLKPIKM